MVCVSVVVPTRNRFAALRAAVASVQAQRVAPDVRLEVVVVDDASDEAAYADGSPLPERPWPVCRVRWSQGTRRRLGYPCAGAVRNLGVRVSTGDYVCFLDDDDAMLPDKVQRQLEFMRRRQVYASWTDARMGRGTYRAGASLERAPRLVASRWPDQPVRWDEGSMDARNPVVTSTVMLHRRLVWDRVGGFLEDRPMGGGEAAGGVYLDWNYWQRVCRFGGGMVYLNEPLGYYDLGHAGGQHYGGAA